MPILHIPDCFHFCFFIPQIQKNTVKLYSFLLHSHRIIQIKCKKKYNICIFVFLPFHWSFQCGKEAEKEADRDGKEA